ncbi:hypothetical protein SAMN05216359_107221 [Roseateles sp. YR242]|nr:hypothetical protein SAMN05216359_107221 [Roseateles sp. YR242]
MQEKHGCSKVGQPTLAGLWRAGDLESVESLIEGLGVAADGRLRIQPSQYFRASVLEIPPFAQQLSVVSVWQFPSQAIHRVDGTGELAQQVLRLLQLI